MHQVNVYPESIQVNIDNIVLVLHSNSEIFTESSIYDVLIRNNHTDNRVKIRNIKFLNPSSLEIDIPKLEEPGKYEIQISGKINSSETTETMYAASSLQTIKTGLQSKTVIDILERLQGVKSDVVEVLQEEMTCITCCNEFICYPFIHANKTILGMNINGGKNITIFGEGISPSSKLVVMDKEIETLYLSDNQVCNAAPIYSTNNILRIGLTTNDVVVYSDVTFHSKIYEISELSKNSLYVNDRCTLHIHGINFDETVGVYLDDILCNTLAYDENKISFTLPERISAKIYNCSVGTTGWRSNIKEIELLPFIEKVVETSVVLQEIHSANIKIYGNGFDESSEVFFGRYKCLQVEKMDDMLIATPPLEITKTGTYPLHVAMNQLISNQVEFKCTKHCISHVMQKEESLEIRGRGLDGNIQIHIGTVVLNMKNEDENIIVIGNDVVKDIWGVIDIYVTKCGDESVKIKHVFKPHLINRQKLVVHCGCNNEKLVLKYDGKCKVNKAHVIFELLQSDETNDAKCMKIAKYECVYEDEMTVIMFHVPASEYPHYKVECTLYIDDVEFDVFIFHYIPKINLKYDVIVQLNTECRVECSGENIPMCGKIIIDDKKYSFTRSNDTDSAIQIPPFSLAGGKCIEIMFDKYPAIRFPVNIYVLPKINSTVFLSRDILTIAGNGFNETLEYKGELNGEEIQMVICSEYESKIITDKFSHEKQNHIRVFSDGRLFFESRINYPEILEKIVPTHGVCSRSHQVIVHGNGFSKQTKLFFGGKTIDEIEVISQIKLKFKIPECPEYGTHNIYTTNADNAKSINDLEYTTMPELSKLSLEFGSCLGKSEIKIYGKGFVNMETVALFWDGKEVKYSVVDNHSIVMHIPPKRENIKINIVLKTEKGFESNMLEYEYLPHVEKLSEYNGYMSGGKTISISGYGFTKNMKILWDNHHVDATMLSETECSIVIPKSMHTKTIDVEVEYNSHRNKQLLKFTYIPHTISSVYPNEGSVKGNYEVTIQGDGMSSEDIYVVIGNAIIHKDEFIYHDKNSIRFLMPHMNSAGKNMIDVFINNVKADKSLDFEYIARIMSLSQNNIQVNAKTSVTIYGEGFNGCSIVKMGTYTIQNITYNVKDGSISFVTPIIEHMQQLMIYVETNYVASNEVMVYVKPIIKNILPNPWIAEDSGFLYVSGEGFQNNVVACIMGLKSPTIINPIKITNTNITFVLPYIKQSGEIVIAIGMLDIAENLWILHKINVQPKITKLSESSGPVIGNNKIEIIGKGFHPRCKIQLCDKSYYFQSSRIEYINENSIMVTMPPSENVEKIKFMAWCNDIPSNSMEYNYCPYIKDIRPNYSSINGGVAVVVEGEGFNAESIVRLNKIQIAKEDTIFDSTTRNLQIIIPKHFEVENMALKVVSNDCESMNTIKFFYTPFLDSLSNTSTSVTKQEIIKLYGNGFSKNTSVKIGDKMANKKNIVKIFDNVMEIKLPVIDEQCVLDIRVITNGIPTAQTKSIAVAAEFSHIEPTEGPIKGGTAIQVYGNGFTDEMTIFFNEVKILYKLISSHQLNIISPADTMILGSNKIQLINNKFSTNLIANFSCYPSISNITQKYDAVNKKMTMWIQCRGFSTNATVYIGKKAGLVAIPEKNTLKIVFEETLKSTNEMNDVYVVTNDLASRDKIFYSTAPIVTKISNNCGIIAGDNQIIIYGSGFDKEQTYILWNKSIKIKPLIHSANTLKFMTPRHITSEKIIYCVVSNEIESIPLEFMYCPEICSISENSCSIGEEISLKIYGEGFEYENSEIKIKNHGKCKIKEYINNKIVEILCGPFKNCGTYDIYAETSGITSQNAVKFEVKPIIVKICNDLGNTNGGKLCLNVIGVTANTSILFCYKDYQIEFNNILVEKTGKKSVSYEIEQITLCYDAIVELKNKLLEEGIDALKVQIKIKTNEIESMPIFWTMKNMETKPNIDEEIIKAITACNTFLSSNIYNKKYQCITPYTDKLAVKIYEMFSEIFEFPEMMLDTRCNKILLDGFMKLYDKNEQTCDEIFKNTIIHMIHSLVNRLRYGSDHGETTVWICKPLLIDAIDNRGHHDYYFQEYIDENESSWLIDAQELSRAICFKIICDGSVEYKYNNLVLDAICDNFEKRLFERKFVLVNTCGKFNGSAIRSPSGTITEMFSCKVTSTLENNPNHNTSCIDLDVVRQHIFEGKQVDGSYMSLAKQLKQLLLNHEIITDIYNNYVKNTTRVTNSAIDEDYTPFPFHRGDQLVLKIMIHKSFSTKELFAVRELTHYKTACDPDSQNRNSAFDFLLNNEGTEIRATNDCYEIILG